MMASNGVVGVVDVVGGPGQDAKGYAVVLCPRRVPSTAPSSTGNQPELYRNFTTGQLHHAP